LPVKLPQLFVNQLPKFNDQAVTFTNHPGISVVAYFTQAFSDESPALCSIEFSLFASSGKGKKIS